MNELVSFRSYASRHGENHYQLQPHKPRVRSRERRVDSYVSRGTKLRWRKAPTEVRPMSKAQRSEKRPADATAVATSPCGEAVADAACNSMRHNSPIAHESGSLEYRYRTNCDTDNLCPIRSVKASSAESSVERAMVLPSVHASSTSRIVSPSNIGTVGCEET